MAVDVHALIPPSPRNSPRWLKVLVVPVVAGIVALGVWIFGGRVTNDFALSLVLTGLFFATAGLAAVIVAVRWRWLAASVLATFTWCRAFSVGFGRAVLEA